MEKGLEKDQRIERKQLEEMGWDKIKEYKTWVLFGKDNNRLMLQKEKKKLFRRNSKHGIIEFIYDFKIHQP